ncbi:hypothetical protein DUNSADRAFT_14644 [Dunaliella salina]|uniref:Secreted protein n=1 Tax=Dunaliella salina TaxID=3046 RepID=A0ABQ7G725_DUNSA|nr:hypothetical protein DUNSADRAFT_14644 [Dunaliella salina]|eukprot:KAF5830401.1 hypothetical protein DUNSADRAFT_14644 [Dunaliella salina]
MLCKGTPQWLQLLFLRHLDRVHLNVLLQVQHHEGEHHCFLSCTLLDRRHFCPIRWSGPAGWACLGVTHSNSRRRPFKAPPPSQPVFRPDLSKCNCGRCRLPWEQS